MIAILPKTGVTRKPFAIARRLLLTHGGAQAAGPRLGDFVHAFGVTHFSITQLDQTREPRPAPRLDLARRLGDVRHEAVVVEGYGQHPAIAA